MTERPVSPRSAGPRTARVVPAQPYLSIAQAASMLGVSRVTIWRWIRAGRLRATRLGHRTIRIDREELVRALTEPGSDGARAWQVQSSGQGRAASERRGRGPGSAGAEHIVQFYESDAYLTRSVARYVGAAIAAGDAAIVIATQAHRDALDRCLSASDLDLE